MSIASLTTAYPPVPRIFPVLYCERAREIRAEIRGSGGLIDTRQGAACVGMIFASAACGRAERGLDVFFVHLRS